MRRRRRFAAIAGAGLFLACYPLVEGFYDIGRVDSLFVFFLLLALFFLRRGQPVLSAFAWVLCFQTKQSVLPVALVLLCTDWQHPRRILAGLGTFAALLGISMVWIDHATHGWYVFYLFHIAVASLSCGARRCSSIRTMCLRQRGSPSSCVLLHGYFAGQIYAAVRGSSMPL